MEKSFFRYVFRGETAGGKTGVSEEYQGRGGTMENVASFEEITTDKKENFIARKIVFLICAVVSSFTNGSMACEEIGDILKKSDGGRRRLSMEIEILSSFVCFV
ncbi:MAG: hypothetical protein ACLRSW_13655 [Christensenellaceae bacterium]